MEEKLMEEVVNQILMAERVESAVAETNSFRVECRRIGWSVGRLKLELHTLVHCISAAAQQLYDRPILRIVAEISKNLERAQILVGKCQCWTLFCRFVIVNRITDFSRIFSLLESSIADLKWLPNLFGLDNGCATGEGFIPLPPIAINDPVISWVWSFIATVKMGKLIDHIDSANNLSSLAQANERNKIIIIEEGGVPPLLNLLKNSSPDAQIAAANALYILADNQERVETVLKQNGVPLIVQLLSDSPLRVQVPAVDLVARMAENDPGAQEAFADEHLIGPLLKLLSLEIVPDEPIAPVRKDEQSIYSVLEMKKDIDKHKKVRMMCLPPKK